MKKKLYIFSVVFLSLCAVAIITCCAIFSNSQNLDNSEQTSSPSIGFESDDLLFAYGSKVIVNFGDVLSVAPTVLENVEIYNFSYISDDESIVSVDSKGDVFTNKCGKTIVEIKNHNVTIKSVEIDVDYRFEVGIANNCIFESNTLYLTNDNARCQFSVVNTKGEEQLAEKSPKISSTSGIVALYKMGNLIISAECSGAVMLSYLEYNINIVIPVVVE